MHSEAAPSGLGNLLLAAVLVLGLILATFMGALVGQNDVRMLALIFGATLAILFAVSLHRYVWQISLLLIFLGFGYRPTSFSFGTVELTCALGFAFIALFIWQNRVVKRPAILEDKSFVFMQRILFAWLAYVALHMIYNLKVPYRPQHFSFNNAVKSYFAVSAPLLLLYYLSRSPTGISVGRKFLTRIAQLSTAGLFFNLVVYFVLLSIAGASLVIPILNAAPNTMLLRTHGPLAMIVGIVLLTAVGSNGGRGTPRVFGWILLAAGTFGAMFSGGRASLFIGAALVCLVLAIRRRVGALIIAVALALVGLVAANVAADWINTRANPYFQRSVQLVLTNKSQSVLETIESSTKWRKELATRAIMEWQSDPRIFCFGRATFGFGAADERAMLLAGGYEALLQISLRRGATHNLVTDLLLAYGIVGTILYLAVYWSILVWLWRLRRSKALTPAAANLALICMIAWLGNLIFEGVGAGTMKIESIWFMIVLIGALYSGIGLAPARSAAEKPQPTAPIRSPASRFRPSRPLIASRPR